MYDRRPLDERSAAVTRVAVIMRESTRSLHSGSPQTPSLRIAIWRESGRLDRAQALERAGRTAAFAGEDAADGLPLLVGTGQPPATPLERRRGASAA